MRKKDILELKKRFKKNQCTFTQLCGCYVNSEKHTLLKFRESFLNLEEDELHKYLEIAKKVLSGTIGNHLLELNFPLDNNFTNESQTSLIQLKKSQLKDDVFMDTFYDIIINNYDYSGNFLILVFHDTYDIPKKSTDDADLDESEEVYEYILCAICPVSLSDGSLSYFENEHRIKARVRDWIVAPPINGFVFPAFINRSSDVNSLIYYTKNPKDTHPELMEDVLGCPSKQTATMQKETFRSVVKDFFSSDEEKADQTFMEVQENLSTIIDEYNSIYDDTDHLPITLTTEHMQNILADSNIPEEIASQIELSYCESFSANDMPLAENLIDQKVLKVNEQRKKENHLIQQVGKLQVKLEQVKEDIVIDKETASNYDVIIQVKPEKAPKIIRDTIDGEQYIVIPIKESEKTIVNGVEL